jgi:two-component system, chemotaxis family, protein-glutamate methylesterase/glutaminase
MEENSLKKHRGIVLIAGSAGSIEVLVQILPNLPETLYYPIVIILHRKSGHDMLLEELIASKTKIPVLEVEDKVPLVPGFIYVAPSDYHLLFEKDYRLSLDFSEKVNYSRPSIDVAFESAARTFGPRLTAILLSGANADGTKGLYEIKKSGGTIIVQDPHTAIMPFMPRNAAENNKVDHTADQNKIVQLLVSLNQS